MHTSLKGQPWLAYICFIEEALFIYFLLLPFSSRQPIYIVRVHKWDYCEFQVHPFFCVITIEMGEFGALAILMVMLTNGNARNLINVLTYTLRQCIKFAVNPMEIWWRWKHDTITNSMHVDGKKLTNEFLLHWAWNQEKDNV